MIYRTLLLVMALLAMGSNYAQRTGDKPEAQVSQLLKCNTAFPDALYETMDWKKFVTSEMASRSIDYHNIDYNLLNAAVFYYTNKFRESRHLEPLLFSAQLRDAAVFHSLEMVNRKFYSHVNTFVPSMRDPSKRTRYFKYPAETIGENIAQQFLLDYKDDTAFTTQGEGDRIIYYYDDNGNQGSRVNAFTYGSFGEHIVKQWILSTPHRENMLSKEYSFMGCGVFASHATMNKNSIPTAFGTQDFGGLE